MELCFKKHSSKSWHIRLRRLVSLPLCSFSGGFVLLNPMAKRVGNDSQIVRVSYLANTAAQHSVHPTGESLRVFRHFAWLGVRSVKVALSRSTHQRVTQAVR